MSTLYADGSKDRRNDVETFDFDGSLVAAFEEVVTKFPSRIALCTDVWKPTYWELNDVANTLAYRLIALSVSAGDRVAILMSHDAPLVAAVLGTLKAGLIVIVLNPEDPITRLKTLLEDGEPSAIVTDAQNQTLAVEIAGTRCRFLNFESDSATKSIANPLIEILPRQTAFLTYTSGTTGRPKAVMQTHRQLRRAAVVLSEAMGFAENDRIPLFASISTGQGAAGVWWILLNGATGYPFPVRTRGVTGLADWIINQGLTVYISSASIFRTLIKTIDDGLAFSNVRAVRLASEAVTANDVQAFRKHFPPTSVLVHSLSCSETTIIAWSRWTQSQPIPAGVLPVGHFCRDMDITLVNEHDQPVAQGEVGEIVVKTPYVAAGYWRDAELTAARFSPELDDRGTRLARTGDLGRIGASGQVEFCGRKDDRIKIHGNRIELADIERALERLPGVNRAAAVAVPQKNHEPMLVAYVVKTSDASWTPPRLRQAARATLPPHMVPSRFVLLDSLPYNRGNKIDREALRQYPLPMRGYGKHEKPRTDTEMLIANIWAEALELPDVGRKDHFFNLGGDSLKGAVVAAQVHAKLGINLSLEAIADHPTVSTLAAFIDERRHTEGTDTSPISPVPRSASMPLSLFQEGMWDFYRGKTGTLVRSYDIVGPLDVGIFKRCLSYLVDRHEILRTTFDLVEGIPAQIIHPSAPLDFSIIDLAGAPDADDRADLVLREAASQTIDLTKLPIMRHVLIRLSNNHHRLVRIFNLIMFDGASAQIFDSELATLYEAGLQGKEPPLPTELPLQYVDYTVWQRQFMRADTSYFRETLKWWKSAFSSAPLATILPFRRLMRRPDLDPGEGVLRWSLDKQVEEHLDDIARQTGATYFSVRLAAFAALIADVTGNSTVVIGTYFDGRDRLETRDIVGRFSTIAFLVLNYDPNKTFLEWVEIVRDRVFETKLHSGLPPHILLDRIRATGMEPPGMQVFFMLSSDLSDRHFGNLIMRDENWSVGTMPWGCIVYVSKQKPEYCQLNFDANLYRRNGMRVMLNRYLQLLEAAAHNPDLSIGNLQTMLGLKPLRWAWVRYATAFLIFIKPYCESSPLLKMWWRHARKWSSARA